MNTAVRTQNVPFLPPAWAALLKRSALFGAGLGIVMVCTLLFIALITYAPTDPSLNTATGGTAENALGLFGATFADAALQIFGLSAAALLAVVGGWGFRLMRGEMVSWLWLRTVAAVAAGLLIATGLDNEPALRAYERCGFQRRHFIMEWSKLLK